MGPAAVYVVTRRGEVLPGDGYAPETPRRRVAESIIEAPHLIIAALHRLIEALHHLIIVLHHLKMVLHRLKMVLHHLIIVLHHLIEALHLVRTTLMRYGASIRNPRPVLTNRQTIRTGYDAI